MARTVSKFVRIIIGDSADTLRHIPVDTINGIGLTYDEVSYQPFIDQIKGVLVGLPGFSCTISGPFDNTTAAASPALSGSHTVLEPLNGSMTPRSFDFQFGMGATWSAGMPQFGMTKTSTSGIIVTDYTVTPNSNGEVKYSAKLSLLAGSAAPAWGTAAETGS
jgi:hypothetical protein